MTLKIELGFEYLSVTQKQSCAIYKINDKNGK